MLDHIRIRRREFLKGAVAAATGTSLAQLLTGCDLLSTDTTETRFPVYIARHDSYSENNYPALKTTVSTMIENLQARAPFLAYGDTVSIKTNIVATIECLRMPAHRTYVASPVVAKALGEALLDLGAGSLYFVEGATHPPDTMQAFHDMGFNEVAEYLGAELIDLNKPDPHASFSDVHVDNGLVYESLKINTHLAENTDCLVSLAKLKCHNEAGVSLSLKNMIGVLPIAEYGVNGTGPRTEHVHQSAGPTTSIPHSIVDLADRFKPDLAFIDGIAGLDRGEGPWVPDIRETIPGLLIAGTNPVATDAVCMSAMGFDPAAAYPNTPFLRSQNHVALASVFSSGTIDIDSIDVLGERLQDVVYPYRGPSKKRRH